MDQLDVTTRVVNSMVDHWPILVGLGAIAWKGLPRALDAYFTNGGGDKFRAIVKSENEVQSRLYKEELDRRLKEHAAEEQRRFEKGDARFREIEGDVALLLGTRVPRHPRRFK